MKVFLPLALLSLPAFLAAANVALTGTATQSTTRGGVPSTASGGNEARFAIDGNRNGSFGAGSVTHTNNTPGVNSWWELDLGSDLFLDSLNIWNRSDCCGNRLDNFDLQVLNSAGSLTYSQNFALGTSGQFDPVQSVTLPTGIVGQTVRIQNNGTNSDGNNIISLAEIEVFGSEYGPNVARGGTATQSSTRGGSPSTASGGNDADVAIDGIPNPIFGDEDSVTHTQNAGPGEWWELDLGAPVGISEITVVNRGDCCTGRLQDTQFDIFRGGQLVWSSTQDINGALYYDVLPGHVVGDTLRITTLNNQVLSFAEVMVFIPEPSRAMLLGLGLIALWGRRSR